MSMEYSDVNTSANDKAGANRGGDGPGNETGNIDRRPIPEWVFHALWCGFFVMMIGAFFGIGWWLLFPVVCFLLISLGAWNDSFNKGRNVHRSERNRYGRKC